MKKIIFLFLIVLAAVAPIWSQTATVTGTITEVSTGAPIDLASVFIRTENLITSTAANGKYKLEVPAGIPFELGFSRIGFKETAVRVRAIPEGGSRNIDVKLAELETDLEIVVTESRIEDAGIVRENMEQLRLLPSTTGNLESVLPSIALGVSSGSGGELSSQYNVRGGNYDENLIF